jgi:UDP-N-acetylglucosamine 2-epimerase (non-hydrolysing)
MASGGKAGRVPELWDGNAAQRIVKAINQWAAAHAR